MSLPFIQQAIQTVQQFPIIQQTQTLRKVYQESSQLQKPLGRFKMDDSFWNQDISKVEIEIAKLLNHFGYHYKPQIIHKFNFETQMEKQANLSLNSYRQRLLEFYENQISDLYLRRQYLLRHRITKLHKGAEDVLFYDPLNKECQDTVPIQMYSTQECYALNQKKELEEIDNELIEIEKLIKEYSELTQKLSHEHIFDIYKFENQLPQIQLSADDDLIFERINQKVYQTMPYITQKHLRNYYDYKQNEFVDKLDDLDTELYIESLDQPKNDINDYTNDYLIPVTMPTLQEEIQELATEQGIEEDMGIDNGALFLYAIDKYFLNKLQEQSNKYIIFLPYHLSESQSKSTTFQQQTVNILNELKQEKIRKQQYRIRSSKHWIDSVQIIPEQIPEIEHILNQYEDSAINSWMKLLLLYESDKIVDKLNKDIAQLSEKAQTTQFPEIYFQFYLRYQKLLFIEARQSMIEIMHCLNVLRTVQKNLNLYFIDLHNLKNQVTTERIQKKQKTTLNAFMTNVEQGDEQTEFQTNPTSSYLCQESIRLNDGIFEVIDGNGYKILNEIIFKDLKEILEKINHLSAFTIQFTIKIGEKHPSSNSQQINRLKAVKQYLKNELEYIKCKCLILQQIMPLLQKAKTQELSNIICLLASLISASPKYKFQKNLLNCYMIEIDKLKLQNQIFQHTGNLRLISKILPIESLITLSQIYKYIRRDKLIDSQFPYKFLYRNPTLDSKNNLNQILHQLPQDGNYNIFSLIEFLSLRRKIYKYSLRIYYLSQTYHEQLKNKGYIKQFISNLQIKANREVTESNLDMFNIVMDEYVRVGKECYALEFWQTIAQDTTKMAQLISPLQSLILIDFYLFNAIQINRLQDQQFINIIDIKRRLSTEIKSKNEQSQINIIQQPHIFRGASLDSQIPKQNSILAEFNVLLQPHCKAAALTYQALFQREYMIDLNRRLPFLKPIFEEGGSFYNELHNISNPFMIHSIQDILEIMKYRETIHQSKIIDNNESDWYTSTKLKIEKNISPLTPNKKPSRFKSSGCPFNQVTELIEPISSSQQLIIQLVNELINLQASNCNAIDLIYFRQGLLDIEILKRNQLRLRRDMDGLQQTLTKIKKQIQDISQMRNIQNSNQTILTYLEKLTKRFHILTLTTLISAIHQFRSEEGYQEIIKAIRYTLCQIQYKTVHHVEKLLNQAPRVYPSISSLSYQSTNGFLLRYVFSDQYFPVYMTNPNNQNNPLFKFTFEDYHTSLTPFMIPTKQILLKRQKLNYNFESFFHNVLEKSVIHLFTLFPQSKLIYYSTIQDLIISETESILREKCIFEVDDVFKYERAYRKILLIQLRYLILSEFFTIQKCQLLPFSNVNSPSTYVDPCTQWLEDAFKLAETYSRRTQLAAGLLMNLTGLSLGRQIDEIKKNQSSNREHYLHQQKKEERFTILTRLRLENFENQIFKLVAFMIGCQALIQEEGISYFKDLNIKIAHKDLPFEMIREVSVFYNNFERDSLKITTLNKGQALVIAESDLNKHLEQLNSRYLKLKPQIQIENGEIQKIYNQKSLELRFMQKKLNFYEENIHHIVESIVAQRTNDLVFENDALKQQLSQQQKVFDIQKQQLRDQIKEEFQDEIRNQNVQIQEMQNRFQDYKRGITMEMSSFITEYKNDGLKRVRDKASEALFGQVNKLNIDLDQEYQRVGVYDQFKEESNNMKELFNSLKKLRTFYLWREMCLKEQHARQIQAILNANSSSEELQQKIQNLMEKVEVLKDELIQNRKIITIMDNQNQILRRDLQKFKVERQQAMREKGQLGAIATYKEQEDKLIQQIQENSNRVRPATAGLLKKPKLVKNPQTQSQPRMPNEHHHTNPKVAFRVLNFFLKAKKPTRIVPQRTLTTEQIHAIFRRAYVRWKAIYRLNLLSQEIVKYGTSSNLFDISTRDRPALQKYLFPLTKTQTQDVGQLEFPVIHPNSYFKYIWNGVFTLLMIYTATILPFRISFFLDLDDKVWFIPDLIIDILFWMDLFVNLFSGYYDEEGKLVLNRKQVMKVYLQGWFTFDLIACFPLSYILDAALEYDTSNSTAQNLKLVKLLKLPRLYRLFRMARVIKLMNAIGKSDILDFFKFNYGVSRLLQLFISVCIIIHISGCIWHYIAAFNDYDPDTWVYRNCLNNQSCQTRYIASVYYAFTTLTTVGYGDIHSKSSAEMIFTIFLMIVGVCFYSFTIGLLSSVLSQIDYKAHKLTKKKAIMNEFCVEKKISRNLRAHLKDTLEYNFNKNCFTWADNQNIFKDLPINLRYDMMMSIHGGIFGNMQLFQLIDDKAFLVRVVPLLKPLMMSEGELLWTAKSNPDAMYFLADGRVNFKTDFVVVEVSNQKKQFSFKSMISGSYFGDVEIFMHTQREHVAQCESQCEMYYLTLTQFECEIYDDFPHVMDKMRKIAKDRHQKNLETITQLQQFIKDATENQLPQSKGRKNTKKQKTLLLRDYPQRKQIKITPFKRKSNSPPPEEQQRPKSKLQNLVQITQEIEDLLE